jgi:DNA polymerase V
MELMNLKEIKKTYALFSEKTKKEIDECLHYLISYGVLDLESVDLEAVADYARDHNKEYLLFQHLVRTIAVKVFATCTDIEKTELVKTEKATGFASPAQGYEAESFDLNNLLIPHPASTFLMDMDTTEMEYRGIYPGSILIVDRAKTPKNGSLAVFAFEDMFLCREMQIRNDKTVFTDRNHEIDIKKAAVDVWGTVTAVINQV